MRKNPSIGFFFFFQVNQALCDLISASDKKMNPHVWTNFPKESSRKYPHSVRVSVGC
jgi:hypothetical protein